MSLAQCRDECESSLTRRVRWRDLEIPRARTFHVKKIKKTCLLIGIAIADDPNVNTKETEELSKYKELDIAISRMWRVRTKTALVAIGALGTVKKGLDQNLQLLPCHRSAIELQKVTLMNTAHSIVKCWGKSLWPVVEIRTYRRQPPDNWQARIN